MKLPRRTVRGLILLGVLGLPPSVDAQESRQALLAQARAEKAKELRPYEPDLAERVLDGIKNFPILSDSPYGWYPLFGGIIDGAGWLRTGVAYRRNFGDAGQFWTGDARISNQGYWQVGGQVEFPHVVRDVLAIRLDGSQQHAPGVEFFGIGNETQNLDDPAAFEIDTSTIGVAGTVRGAGALSIGGRVGFEQMDTGPLTFLGPPSSRPFPEGGVPANATDVRYVHSETFVDLDWREAPGYTRSGSHARLGVHHYDHTNGDRFSFTRVDATASHHFGFLNGSRVIAVHAQASLTSVGDGQSVPHFMLPYIGGGTTVRSLPSFRFRDRHRLVVNAEYRWRASELIDMVVFGDAGKVAATRRHLDFHDLTTAVGIGIRLHSPSVTAVRLEAAHGEEGFRVRFAFGPVF